MTQAELVVLQCRLQTMEFINQQLVLERDKLRSALDSLLDAVPADARLTYYPSVERAYAALNRIY
jgi:regulator of replication initiation timing